jgi:hypothetical protein
VAKYGKHILHQVDWSDFRTPSMSSKWWKDIYALDKVVMSNNWLVELMVRCLGNDNSTFFGRLLGLVMHLSQCFSSVVFPF